MRHLWSFLTEPLTTDHRPTRPVVTRLKCNIFIASHSVASFARHRCQTAIRRIPYFAPSHFLSLFAHLFVCSLLSAWHFQNAKFNNIDREVVTSEISHLFGFAIVHVAIDHVPNGRFTRCTFIFASHTHRPLTTSTRHTGINR